MEERHLAAPRLGRGEPPMHAGLSPTFCGQPLVLDPAALDGVDVAVVGAPFDDGTSNRPGARFGPRAIRAWDDEGRYGRPHLHSGIDPFAVLDVVNHGDAEPAPGDLARSHDALADVLRGVLTAGAVPLVLGGDHSLSLPTLRVLAERFGADGYAVVHFDTHADTARSSTASGSRTARRSASPSRRAPCSGPTSCDRPARRWPGRRTSPGCATRASAGTRWTRSTSAASTPSSATRSPTSPAARRASTSPSTSTCSTRPSRPAPARPSRAASPARTAHRAAPRGPEAELCAADVVEVCPPFDPTGITALAGERAALDILTGMAMRRRRG